MLTQGLISSLRHRRLGVCLVGGLLILLACSSMAAAQVSNAATLKGTVKDSSGAVVVKAKVTLTSNLRGDSREATTNDAGGYVFTSVDAGPYSVTVEASGFKTSKIETLNIVAEETRSHDVTLEVGAAAETVTVVAEQEQIKTETGERSDTITAKQLDTLSIIGRSSLELLRILPGVVGPDAGSGALDLNTFGGGGNANASYTVNGIRGVNNNVSIDGSRLIDIGSNNGTIITPNVDMVQEVTVKTSNYAAEYGNSGVQISAVTKGGGKGYHGEIYDYWRPKSLSANDRSNTTVLAPQPNVSYQYPGGQIGGPIPLPFTNFNKNRDKLFFFVGFEVQRQNSDPGTHLGTVPTANERQGLFGNSPHFFANGICPPSTFQYAPCSSSQAIPNGNLSSMVDPVGKALLNLFPMPNFSPAAGSPQARFNYASSVLSPQNRTDFKSRFDYNVSSKTKIYVRLARETESQDSAYGIWWGPSSVELPSHLLGTNLGRSAAANVTSIISPTMTNEVVFSVSKLQLNYNFQDPSKLSKSALGISNFQLPFKTPSPYAPVALISWDVGTQLWEPGNLPLFAFNDSESVTDTVSKVYKNHTLKFGALIEQANKKQDLNATPEGQVEYEGGGQARTTGNAFANLFVGQINGITQSTFVPTGKFRFWNVEGYAQDSWKLRPNFTLELGLRVSYLPNNYERTGLGVAFDPNAYKRGAGAFLNGNPNTPNGYLLASQGQIPLGVFNSNVPPQIAPRFGFAWDISGRGDTVIRGGAGVFYNRVQGNYQYGVITQPPNTLTMSQSSWGAANNDLTLGKLGSINPLTVLNGISVSSQDRNSSDGNRIPRITTYSLSVAKRLPYQTVLEVAYVATFGRHLPQTLPVNVILPQNVPATLGNANLRDPLQRAAVAANAAAFSQLNPFPDFGGVGFGEYIGTSNYHSMQATLNHSAGKSLQFFATYTFSKALGTTANSETGGSDVNPIDTRGRSYGILSYDRTHIFNLSYNWQMPKLARGIADNKFMRGVLDGWQMSGITTFESGRPIPIRFSGDIASATTIFSYFSTNVNLTSQGQTGGIAPIFLKNPVTGNTGIGQSYLDLNSIAIPGFGQSGGYQPAFYMRSPSRHNFDVTFFKNFGISENKKIQFRAGFFNIFNEAYANTDLSDINLTLQTVCNQTAPAGINNGTGQTTTPICDPTKGFHFATPAENPTNNINTFGKVINKHGHRRVELAFKFYF